MATTCRYPRNSRSCRPKAAGLHLNGAVAWVASGDPWYIPLANKSFACWFRAETFQPNTWPFLIHFTGWKAQPDAMIAIDGSSKRLYVTNHPGAKGQFFYELAGRDVPLATETWHHVIMVIDAHGMGQLYLNGECGSSLGYGWDRTGLFFYSLGSGFNGRLRNIRFYDRALTPVEALRVYTAGRAEGGTP